MERSARPTGTYLMCHNIKIRRSNLRPTKPSGQVHRIHPRQIANIPNTHIGRLELGRRFSQFSIVYLDGYFHTLSLGISIRRPRQIQRRTRTNTLQVQRDYQLVSTPAFYTAALALLLCAYQYRASLHLLVILRRRIYTRGFRYYSA